MATKTKTTADPNAGKKRYIVNPGRRLASKLGDEAWEAGAEVWLDDFSGGRHCAKGTVSPADETKPPAVAPPTVAIHEAKEGVTNGDSISSATD